MNNSNININVKITSKPEFKIPETTTEEIGVRITDTTQDIIQKVNEIKKTSSKGCTKIKIPKGFGPATDAGLDIFYSWDEEGPAQAIITGIGATRALGDFNLLNAA